MILKLNKKEKHKLKKIELTEEELSYLITSLMEEYLEYRDYKLYKIIQKIENIISSKEHTKVYREITAHNIMSYFSE